MRHPLRPSPVALTRLALLAAVLTLAGAPLAAAATGGWSGISLPPHSGLAGVACVSPKWCLAVGGWRGRPTAARWTGARWTPAPRPARPPHAAAARLVAVACRGTRMCIGVGEVTRHGSREAVPLAERWNGTRWRVMSPPHQWGAAAGAPATGSLLAVDCPATRTCLAVGRSGAAGGPGSPLIERWNGRRWSRVAGARATGPLTSISCATSRACTAVGGVEYRPPGAATVSYDSVVERWRGGRWRLGSLRGPTGADGSALLGVSCARPSTCIGVGNEEATPTYGGVSYGTVNRALAGPGNGLRFRAKPLPLPAAVFRIAARRATPQTALSAVACPTTEMCAAVGTYTAHTGLVGPLVATRSAGRWRETAVPEPSRGLTSVACPTARWCIALGGGVAERFIG